jgi:3-isopropylmalate/(R)-2-methylmalate dehydratase small subunit
MGPFERLTSVAIPLPGSNIDTDVIFPARFLLITTKTGLGRYAFYEWRYHRPDQENPEFVLNNKAFKGASIMVAGDNFGCGSSREQAAWALADLGLKCVIATSFGEIFQTNCFKNGLLAVAVPPEQQKLLLADAESGSAITVDLEAQTLSRANGEAIAFQIEPWRREALLNGWDEIAIVLNQDLAAITAFEQRQRAEQPWLYVGE